MAQLGGDRFAVTDAAGKFSGRIVRELTQPFGWPVRIPAPFFQPADITFPRQSMPQRGVAELELTAIVLARGVDVRGTVVGEDSKPVAGAEVEAIWTDGGGSGSGGAGAERSDRRLHAPWRRSPGRSEPHRLGRIRQHARRHGPGRGRRQAGPSPWPSAPRTQRPSAAGSSTPPASRSPARRSGSGGRSATRSGARSSSTRSPTGTAPSRSAPMPTGATARDGDSRPTANTYAEAFAPGRLSARSPGITATRESDQSTVLVLRRVRTIEGRVVDRQGQPVAGAVVRQSGDGPMPTETVSDEQGRFRLPGVIEGPALVFAAKEGFRFGYRWRSTTDRIRPRSCSRGPTEPPAVVYHSLPPVLPVEEGKVLARRLILPPTEKILQHGKDADKYRFLVEHDGNRSDRHARAAGVDQVCRCRLSQVPARDSGRGPGRENLDEATELLEASDAADVRAGGYWGSATSVAICRPDQVKELLVQAGVNAKGMKSTTYADPDRGPDRRPLARPGRDRSGSGLARRCARARPGHGQGHQERRLQPRPGRGGPGAARPAGRAEGP